MAWTSARRVFAVETIFHKTGVSVIVIQRAFCVHYMLRQNYVVPGRKSIQLWAENFKDTGSTLKSKPPGRPRSARSSG